MFHITVVTLLFHVLISFITFVCMHHCENILYQHLEPAKLSLIWPLLGVIQELLGLKISLLLKILEYYFVFSNYILITFTNIQEYL